MLILVSKKVISLFTEGGPFRFHQSSMGPSNTKIQQHEYTRQKRRTTLSEYLHVKNRYNMSLNATKRPFGHMDIGVGNSKKVGKLCFIHFGSNTAFVCFEHWITKLTN